MITITLTEEELDTIQEALSLAATAENCSTDLGEKIEKLFTKFYEN